MEEKRNLRKAALLIMGTIGLIVLAIVVGVPVLTRMALVIGTLKSSNSTIDKTDTIPPAAPVLSLPYDATNSAQQVISGLAEPGSTVYITQNSYSEGNVVTDPTGGFVFSKIKLFEGDNEFFTVAIDEAGNKSVPSKPTHMYYSSHPPKLSLDSPIDHQIISGGDNSIQLKGATENAARLSVNGHNIILGSTGRFDSRVNLSAGDNILVFIITDSAGNEARQELAVTYSP